MKKILMSILALASVWRDHAVLVARRPTRPGAKPQGQEGWVTP